MNRYFLSNFILTLLMLIMLAFVVQNQPQCRISRMPQVIPLQTGQQAIINLEEYFSGPNITLTVQPNDFYANIREQYACKSSWNHQIGTILSTQTYEVKLENSTQQLIAMLGGSAYFSDLYYVYYGVNVTFSEEFQKNVKGNDEKTNNNGKSFNFVQENVLQNDVLVLQVPRGKLTSCKQFSASSNSTHIQFVLDCFSLSNNQKKMFASTVIEVSTNSSVSPIWEFNESPIYLPEEMISKLRIHSKIQVITVSKSLKFLLRMIVSQYNDYIELWRWSSSGKQIINLYDKQFFIDSGILQVDDIDLRMWQVVDSTIIVLDMYNGLHLVDLNPIGRLQYKTNLQFEGFNYFFYDDKQQILFMGKRGKVQQYQIEIFSDYQIKANRVQRYHLYGFQQINQIITQNRFLYVRTNSYTHIVHLTNIQSNDQSYDGSYKVYPQIYVQKLIPTIIGFIKVVNADSNVKISACETHPPFLNLRTPQSEHHFVINGYSTVNGRTVYCYMPLTTEYSVPDEDLIYSNGHNSENDTLFSNRPGRSVVELQKFGIGKNVEYNVILINHKISFDYNIKKVNNQSCTFSPSPQREELLKNTIKYNDLTKLQANQPYITTNIGSWIIVSYPQKRIKQYYKCEKYLKIECKFITLYIVSANQTSSVYQIIQDQKTKKQSLQQAIAYKVGNVSRVEVNLYVPKGNNSIEQKNQGPNNKRPQQQDEQNFKAVLSLCRIRYPTGIQYDISEIKLRDNKIYVLLPHLKRIQIYVSLISLQSDQKCHYLGSLNVSSFKNPSIYFNPRHMSFNNQDLGEPYDILSMQFMQRQSFSQISESIQTLFVIQFNEILIVRLIFDAQQIKKTQLLKHLIADRFNDGSQIDIIVTLPHMLLVDYTQAIIEQYYVTHTFDSYYVRGYKFPKDKSSKIQLLDKNTFAASLSPDSLNQSYVQVYKMNSLVAAFKQYASWKITGTFHAIKFNDEQFQVMQLSLPTANALQCNAKTLSLFPLLQIQIPTKNIYEQPSMEQFYLSLFTIIDSARHILALQVASDSSEIQKGPEYPYQTYSIKIQQDQSEAFFEIDDRQWFEGNVFNQRYLCDDCKNGRVNIQNRISLKNKFQLQSDNIPNDLYVKQLSTQDQSKKLYQFQTIQGYLLTKISPNINKAWNPLLQEMSIGQDNSYTFAETFILSSNIVNEPQCIKAGPQKHDFYFVTLCQDHEFLDQSALLQIRLHSKTGFKSFSISEYIIQIDNVFSQGRQNFKSSTTSQKQIIIISSSLQNFEGSQSQNDVLFVRFYDNIWIFLVINGKLELIQTLDRVDFGDQDHLCWMEVIQRGIIGRSKVTTIETQKLQDSFKKTLNQYGIIASMCQTGLYYLVFEIDAAQNLSDGQAQLGTQRKDLPSFHLVSEQQIDLQLQLQKKKIQLPEHSYFLQTIVKQIEQDPTSFFLYSIVENFNSFIWRVQLSSDTIAISSMSLQGIIRRYNEYSPIHVTSSGDNYFTVLYKSTQRNSNVSQFLAAYETSDFVIDTQTYIKQYFFYAGQKTNTKSDYRLKSQVAQIGSNIVILNQNTIKMYETLNRMKINVQRKIVKAPEDQKQDLLLDQNYSRNQLLTYELQTDGYNEDSGNQMPQLYSQSIIIFYQTPTELNRVTIKLFSIDFFQLTFWQITGIVIGGLVILVLLGYGSNKLWVIIQRKRRLVKLETDILDDGSQNQNQIKKSVSSQRDDNQSPYNRQSQITTSDSPLGQSLIEKPQIEEPLIAK